MERSPSLSAGFFFFLNGSERVVYTLKHHKLHACFLPLLLCVRGLRDSIWLSCGDCSGPSPGPWLAHMYRFGHAPPNGSDLPLTCIFGELSIMQPAELRSPIPRNYLLCIFQCFCLTGKYGNGKHFEWKIHSWSANASASWVNSFYFRKVLR